MTSARNTSSIKFVPVAHSGHNNDHTTPAIREALMRYRPTNVRPDDWDVVKDFVREAVLAYGPSSTKIAVEIMSTTTRYVLWATKEMDAPLDRDDLFYPGLMTQYLKTRASTKDSGAYRTLYSRLFRVANAVADVSHNRKKLGRVHHDFHYYSRKERAEIESWAFSRKNALLRRYARIFLALAGGAGLWVGEILQLRGRDITHTANGYTVTTLGRNPRTVPIRTDWAHYLDGALTDVDADEYILYPNGTDLGRPTSLKALYRGPHPAPTAAWLRDTWVYDLLATLPAGVAMQAAGMPDATTLRRYLNEMPAEDVAIWEPTLRDPAAITRGDKSPNECPLWTEQYRQQRNAIDSRTASDKATAGGTSVIRAGAAKNGGGGCEMKFGRLAGSTPSIDQTRDDSSPQLIEGAIAAELRCRVGETVDGHVASARDGIRAEDDAR